MRYSPNHRAETHKAIVEAAAREFRARGVQGISISDLMSSVGLTQGGFYAHFKDRDALVAEAVTEAASQSLCRLVEAAEAAPGREVEAMLGFYLSAGHRDDPGQGCLLPALSADLARQPPAVRVAFTGALKANMSRLARFMPATDAAAKRAQAMAFVSGMVGGLALARAVDDPKLSKTLLDSVRSQLLGAYGPRPR